MNHFVVALFVTCSVLASAGSAFAVDNELRLVGHKVTEQGQTMYIDSQGASSIPFAIKLERDISGGPLVVVDVYDSNGEHIEHGVVSDQKVFKPSRSARGEGWARVDVSGASSSNVYYVLFSSNPIKDDDR